MLTGEVIWNAAEEGCAAGVRTAAGDGGESEAGVQRERGRSGVGGELVPYFGLKVFQNPSSADIVRVLERV